MPKTKQPIILITNDDGVTAPGIAHLVHAVKHLGRVVVVAPDKPQSGMGHAITIMHPLRFNKVHLFDGVEAYQTNGTPADCVKLAIDKILKQQPTICLSGINHGANHCINVIYSGTMSAAMEAAIDGVPAAGFSLLDYAHEADFTETTPHLQQIVHWMLSSNKNPHLLLNVNFPKKSTKKIKGIKVCRQAKARYKEDYSHRSDPSGRDYYWLAGTLEVNDKGTDTDHYALSKNYISVVPISIDFTNHEVKKQLQKKFL
jgi:5'-nucleotidase